LRSLEKIIGESKHEMAWRTEKYSLSEAEKWTRESLRDVFYVHVDSKKMASGGMMADGGEIGQGFLIRDMREKLNNMFPDSFGFTVGNFSKEGNEVLNSSALIVNKNDPYRGLEDKDIQSKLFFPQYKRDHDIRFRIYQGGENTYFYFLLESEKGDQYVGQFGFKDQGDVLPDYITRFIAFLMAQYGLPFEVKHNVMAKGGYMASGGEIEVGDKVKYKNAKYHATVTEVVDDSEIPYAVIEYSDGRIKKAYLEDLQKVTLGYATEYVNPKYMAGGGEMHKADQFKDGGELFSEKKLKEILDEALGHFYQGLNQIDLAMRYLQVKGQGGLRTPLSDKLKLDGLKESVEKIDEYVSK
jgi:hypothetical protein